MLLSLFQDVSNQTSEGAGEKGGQPNVTKRGAAVAPPRRAVTLESREDNADDAPAQADRHRDAKMPSRGGAGHHPQAALAAPPAAVAEGMEFNTTAYQYSAPADDIDERDADDPLCATSYVQDMYEHFRTKETSTSVRPVYMEDQQFINERMRSILVDWLVEVHLKFKLVPETLYLTVNIIDRYLAKTEVSRPKLQLVGVTALLIASKYEEIYPPELRDLVYICDRAYSKIEVGLSRRTLFHI